MTSDHLGSRVLLAPTPGGMVLGASTYTFGLGFAVRQSDGIAPFPGSAGDFNWGGYAGTFFWVDPKEQLVAVFKEPADCTMKTATSCSLGSTQKNVPAYPPQLKSPAEPGTGAIPSEGRTAKPRPNV